MNYFSNKTTEKVLGIFGFDAVETDGRYIYM